jgi:hypothetical protein
MGEVEVNEGGDVVHARVQPPDRTTVRMHRRGHHVQKAHGRRVALAADSSHQSGGMIALMPTAADAKRLALKGGETAPELHCTLLFLGDDGDQWPDEARDAMEAAVRSLVLDVPPIESRIFGVAHWNGDGDKPSWVWSVGDNPDHGVADSSLEEARWIIGDVMGMAMAALDGDMPEVPKQHSPWVAHICAAYTDDLTLVRELEKRLGPVTFDRIRLSFGDDDRDIPLEGHAASLTAAGLRRDALPHEEGTDFAEHNRQWEGAVTSTANRLNTELAEWRAQVRDQIIAGADTPEELAGITVDTGDAVTVLRDAMTGLAERAGQSLQREAERQGVEVPEWSLPDDTVTAAVGGRRLLDSVARMTADLMSTSVVQTAKRVVTGLFAQEATPEVVAAEVDRVLAEGQDGLIKSQIGTAMSTAQTAGRQAVLEAAPPGEYYASEMLDKNTCAPCRSVDGEQFGDLERAIKAYPVMGYKDCVGPRYGNSCRGMIVARWTPEDTEDTEAVNAGGQAFFHGTKGAPGYGLLHGNDKVTTMRFLAEGEEEELQEGLNQAYYNGFTSREYNAYTDSGSYLYDPDDELSEGERNYVDWEGLSRYYASGAGGDWYSNFEGSRNIRREANALAGLDQTGHDRLLGEGDSSLYRVEALALLTAVASAPPVDRPLYRGSFYEGADPDEIEKQLRSTDSLDFSVVSFTDGQGVADYFADPALYEQGGARESQGGTQVMYEVDPGAQGVLGHIFTKDMRAGNPGENEDDADYVNSDEALTDFTTDHPREIITGGNFEVGEIVRDGNRITVRLRQTKTHPPVKETES